jgi:hypothetical protein
MHSVRIGAQNIPTRKVEIRIAVAPREMPDDGVIDTDVRMNMYELAE